MFIQLDRTHDDKFIYQQIYESIQQQILAQTLKEHEKLPSKRALAQQLQVSINSVILAYEQLLAEGYIYAVERSGYFVESVELFEATKKTTPLPAHLKEVIPERKGWVSLSHMNTDASTFPMKSWMKNQLEAFERFQGELSVLPGAQGPYALRQAIANYIVTSRGVQCEPEQIFLHATTQGLLLQFFMMQQKSAMVALENPGYARYYELLKQQQLQAVITPLDKSGISIDALQASKPDFVITTPSHQFPTCTIMPISRRVELLNWAYEQPNRYILEDDYDSDFKYKTDNIPSLHSLDTENRVVYLGTFSKTLLPGMRISYMVLPPQWIERYQQQIKAFIQPANSFALYTLTQFIESGQYEKHVRKMNSYYEDLRSSVIEELQREFRQNIQITYVTAGLHLLVQVNTTKTYDAIEKNFEREKLEMYSIRRFLLAPDAQYTEKRYFIVGFSNIKKDWIPTAVQRFYRAVHSYS